MNLLGRIVRKARLLAGVARSGDAEAVFHEIYDRNAWGDPDSVSGKGSNLQQTAVVREMLPAIIAEFAVHSILDLPCGDFHWMSAVDLGGASYLGGDIVPELVDRVAREYGGPGRSFQQMNLLTDALPRVDLLLRRDCLVHFRYADVWRALAQIRTSGSGLLLTTTFPSLSRNHDIDTGDWRPLNLQVKPFCFPSPLGLINEQCTEENGRFADKSLALWRIDQLPYG
jgi:hypothetical protein